MRCPHRAQERILSRQALRLPSSQSLHASPLPQTFDTMNHCTTQSTSDNTTGTGEFPTAITETASTAAAHPQSHSATSPQTTAPPCPVSTGAELIAAERLRQMREEGWTAENDDEFENGELALAGAAYALAAVDDIADEVTSSLVRRLWPWTAEWWKPKGPLRDLVRAGALLAAEIDRVLRNSEDRDERLARLDLAVGKEVAA